tara:strand:- start:1397 stop:2140 length:744 start_codon:yes stop_codon:yes gene_type:complete
MKKMKGIILAGGTGSRLNPLTKATNKHLLPVGGVPMIYHPLMRLINAGVIEIMIITGTEHMGDMITTLGSGREFGCEITYKVQDMPNGIAGALLLCESFVGNDLFVVLLGDNIFENNFSRYIEKFQNIQTNSGIKSMLLLKKISDPERFGVATIKDGKITKIIEKPKIPESNLCVTGAYFYDKKVFDFIRETKPSDRNELEITDVNNRYVDLGSCYHDTLEGWWTDAGTHSSYNNANLFFINGDNKS